MTRDGLVEQNQASGEEHRVSHGERDFAAHPKEPGCGMQQARAGPVREDTKGRPARLFQPNEPARPTANQGTVQISSMQPPDGTSPQAVFSSDDRAENVKESVSIQNPASGKAGLPNIRPPGAKRQRRFHDDAEKHEGPPKLQFTQGETPPGSGPESPALSKLHRRAEGYDAKLAEAREHLPARRRVRLKREADETGKLHRRLRFDREVRERTSSKPLTTLAAGAAGAAIAATHGKIEEAGQENVGIEAGHKAEQAAESLAGQGTRFLYRRAKNSPYRRVARLERKATKANVNYLYRQTLEKDPALRSDPLSRMLQKRKIRQQYVNAARVAKSGAKGAAKGTASIGGKIRRLLKRLVGPHKKVLVAILAILFALFFLISLISSCSAMLSNGFQSILSTSYTASDSDINQAETYYSGLEANLRKQIDDAEQDHPGYDEYDYQIGVIGHDPHELISYLTALYDDFALAQVQPILQQLFNRQYQLSFIATTQTRQRAVTTTDPTTGATVPSQESYLYRILAVNLNAADFSQLIASDLSRAGVSDKYAAYMQSGGNRQYFASPFSFDWNPYVENIGSDESAQIDVSTGTQVLSMLDGTVTQAGGGTVVIEDGKGLKAVYSGCGSIGVHTGQSVKIGTGIAASGSGFTISVSNDGTALNPILFILDPDSCDSGPGSLSLSGSVESNRQLVTQLAGQYGMQGYINLILAVMQQESGGRGGDPMQAAEGPYNTKYPHRPNGITDPAYSIKCGIQELKAALQEAGCTSPTDMSAIDLALQGYNFGSGFITWAQQNGGYSLANAQAFSQMEAAKLGWSSYGDPEYVPHVLRYYKTS